MLDFMVFLLYGYFNQDSNKDKDHMVLSKGHCAGLLYTILCDMGKYTFEEITEEYNTITGRFGTHPNHIKIPEIEFSSGALGHGASIAVGMAITYKKDKRKGRIYSIIGDGELNEGSNWEAFMFAKQYSLQNYIAVIDKNEYSSSQRVENVMNIDPLNKKMESFGFDVIELNGNSTDELYGFFETLRKVDWNKNGNPLAVILHTKKGYGVEEIEKNPRIWHNGHVSDQILLQGIKTNE